MNLNKEYWQGRWQAHETGWDIGYASPAIIEYAEKNIPHTSKILIPGCGNAYEAEVLFKMGYRNVFVVDIAPEPLNLFKNRISDFPSEQLLCSDFFSLEETGFDYILEQTFFCALDPALRADYACQVANLLAPNGILSGLLFDFPLTEEGPPFGGSKDEYLNHFVPHFEILQLEKTSKSIKPRLGREFFIEFKKK